MKGLMAKLRGMPFKEILIGHGEKIVLGMVGLIVLLALISTTWGGIDKRPDELLTIATTAGTKLHTGEWPAEKQVDFKPSTYQTTALGMFQEMNDPNQLSVYAYDKPMTFPLYKREEPRGEVEWPTVQDLLADYSQMVISVNPPQVDQEGIVEGNAGEEDVKIPPKSNFAAGPLGGAAAGMPLGMMPEGMGGGGGATSGTLPRGQRYVALRGTVNLYEIGKAIQHALHLETAAEGMAMIDVIDFQIERQKAVAGPNPWLEANWVVISLERADEVLAEATGQAADLVASGCINPVFTMPLPSRLDGDYTAIISHPSLERFQLSKEQREMEQKLNSAIQDAATELGVSEKAGKRRGFIQNQVDINGLRNDVVGAGGNMGDILKNAGISNTGAGGMMPPGGQGSSMSGFAGGGRSGPGMGPNLGKGPSGNAGGGRGGPAGGMMPPGGMAGGGMQSGGATVGANAAGTLMLFRYLDFDVNPGEAYRYRVKLEFANPNYLVSTDQVKEASVAENETRTTAWSEPSAPVVVKADTNTFLADIDKRQKSKGEARILMYQWDASLGTYIDSKLVTKFGQFLGGLAESPRLDLGTPSFEDKVVLFASKEFLLDTSLPPTLLASDNPELNLQVDAKQAKDGLDLPAEAVVLDEYGQLRVLNSVAEKQTANEVDKKVKAERKPWEHLKVEAAETENPLGAAAGAAGGMSGMMDAGMMSSPTSTLKRGGKGGKGGGAAGGAMMPGGMPGMGGSPKNKKGASNPMGDATTKKKGR